MISYKGLTEAEVLVALYHNTRARGMGVFQDKPDFDLVDAEGEIDWRSRMSTSNNLEFDYVRGRPIKVTLLRDRQEIHRERLYDRDSHTPCAEVIAAALEVKNA